MLPEYKKIKRKKMTAVSEIIPAEVAKLQKKSGMNRVDAEELQKKWVSIVGEALAKVTHPQKIFKKRLFIQCTSPTWKNELLYHKEDILQRIQAFLGDEIVQDISFS